MLIISLINHKIIKSHIKIIRNIFKPNLQKTPPYNNPLPPTQQTLPKNLPSPTLNFIAMNRQSIVSFFDYNFKF
jgi:hypothetical protein